MLPIKTFLTFWLIRILSIIDIKTRLDILTCEPRFRYRQVRLENEIEKLSDELGVTLKPELYFSKLVKIQFHRKYGLKFSKTAENNIQRLIDMGISNTGIRLLSLNKVIDEQGNLKFSIKREKVFRFMGGVFNGVIITGLVWLFVLIWLAQGAAVVKVALFLVFAVYLGVCNMLMQCYMVWPIKYLRKL